MKVERKWLLAILVLSFALRSLPFIWGVIPGLDSYLHRDIALRILEKKSLLSYDLLSLIGLRAYSYPAGFHLLLALFLAFLNDRVACQVVPALSGTLSVLLVFYLAKELFSDERISLGAAFLLSTSPSHIYRSSLCIPESVGILFYISSIFFAARFLKERKVLNLLWLAIIMTFYLFFHRGWFFAFLTLGIIFSFNFYDTLFLKKKNLIFLLVLILFLSIFAKSLFFELLLRFPREPVTALGYLKWVGALQIFFATLSMLYLLKERDRMSYSLIAWALTLLGFGSISFRFRDPYSTFPVSLLASHFIMRHLVPFLNSLKLEGLKRISLKNLVFSSIFLLCISQALYTSLFLVEHPNPYELEALDFLEKNTPKDSIVLTWK
ncbi:MAG: glycosyltransferase family 39 protein, partial [Candidatus Methanofastidiosia archaeon]